MQHNGIGFVGKQRTEETKFSFQESKLILALDENKHTCFISLICSNIFGLPERDQVCLLCSGGNVLSYMEFFVVCISLIMSEFVRPWNMYFRTLDSTLGRAQKH